MTRNFLVLPLLALATLISPFFQSSSFADDLLTVQPGFEGIPLNAQLVETATLKTDLDITTLEAAPDSLVSYGDYSDLYLGSASELGVDPQKAIDLLDADFNVVSEALIENQPAIAFNSVNGDYLVVYVRHSGGATGLDIYGQRLSATGALIGAPFAIIVEPASQLNPRVIYNPVSNEFLVVCWETNGVVSSALARVVPASGTPTALIWDPFATFTNINSVDAAYNATSAEYLVTAGQSTGDAILFRPLAVGTGTPQSTESLFRDGDGVVDTAPRLLVYPTTGQYVFITERDNAGLRGIYAYTLDAAKTTLSVLAGFTLGFDTLTPSHVADTGRGEIFFATARATDVTSTVFNTVIGVINITTGAVTRVSVITNATTDDRRPEVAYQSTEDDFLVTWWRLNAASPPVSAINGGTTGGVTSSVISSLATVAETSSIAVNGSESMVVWTEFAATADIRGRRLGTAAPSLSVNPTSLDFGSSTSSLGLALTNTGTGSLLWGTTAPAWVTRSPGTDTFFNSQNITVGVNRAGFPPGTYNTTLTLLVANATDVDVPITMTVPNTAPTVPSNPSPVDMAAGQATTLTLDWTSSDPDVGQILVYDFYLSTNQALVDGLDASVRLGSDFTMSEVDASHLVPLTTYFWRAVAKDGVTTVPGPTWRFTTARVGMTTLTPIADQINDSTPTFQWSAVSGAASYRLEVATDPDFGNIALIVPGLTTTTYTPPSALEDTGYFWTVLTVAANGTESFSPSADSFTIDTTAPAVPTLDAVTSPSSNPRPDFTWSASAEAASYVLEVATDAGFANIVLSSSPSTNALTPTSDLPEDSLFWRVAAVDTLGNQSAFSVAGNFEIDQTAPPVPSLIAAPDPTGDARQTLSWNASTGAANYRIQVSDDSFATTLFDQAGLTATSFTPSSDLPEDTIEWRVQAVDAAGNTSAFSTANTFTVDLTAPDVPTLTPFLPDPTNNPRPELTWNAVAGATEYSLFVEQAPPAPGAAGSEGGSTEGGNVYFSGVVSGTSWTPTSDLPEETIIWSVASRDASGNQSLFSVEDSFTIDLTPPAVPTLTPVAPDPTSNLRPSLSWSAEADAVAYRVQVSTVDTFATTLHDVSTIATSYTPSADLPEGPIYWRVASRDVAENDSAFTAPDAFAIDLTPPGVPSLNAVTPDPTHDPRPTLAWNAVAGAADYRLQVSVDAAFASTLFDLNVAGTSWAPAVDLPEGLVYWRVASRDEAGNQSAFAAADSFTIDVTPPDAPTLNALLPDPTNNPRPELTWNAVAGAAEYSLFVGQAPSPPGAPSTEGGNVYFSGVVSGTSWTPTSDLPEETIIWLVASRDATGNQSSFSEEDFFTIDLTSPAVPTLTPVTPDPTANPRPGLSWSAETDAVAYRVQVSTVDTFATTLHDVSIAATSYTPSADLPEGPIYWRVASRDLAENDSAFAVADSFTVDVTAPDIPTLNPITPNPTNDPRPTFSWQTVSGAVEYQLTVSSVIRGSVIDVTVAGNSFTPTSDLSDGDFAWQVASRDALGNQSASSAASSFTIDTAAPGIPALLPVSPDPTNDPRPLLAWGAVSGATEYRIQVSTDMAFTSTLFDLDVAGTSWIPTSDLPEGTIYWRASSRDALGNESEFANADSFMIDVTAPALPILVPVSPNPTTDPRPALSWSTVVDAALYHLQVASNPAFVAPLVDITQAATSFTPSSDLPEGQIFWRVSSLDALGNESTFTAFSVFEINQEAPPAITGLRVRWENSSEWTLLWQSSEAADFAFYAIYRETTPITDTTGLTPIDTSITDPVASQFIDPAPLAGDVYYAVVAVDGAGNALTSVESLLAPGPAPLFADSFETGDTSLWTIVVNP